jgi:hypothetical protein
MVKRDVPHYILYKVRQEKLQMNKCHILVQKRKAIPVTGLGGL